MAVDRSLTPAEHDALLAHVHEEAERRGVSSSVVVRDVMLSLAEAGRRAEEVEQLVYYELNEYLDGGFGDDDEVAEDGGVTGAAES